MVAEIQGLTVAGGGGSGGAPGILGLVGPTNTVAFAGGGNGAGMGSVVPPGFQGNGMWLGPGVLGSGNEGAPGGAIPGVGLGKVGGTVQAKEGGGGGAPGAEEWEGAGAEVVGASGGAISPRTRDFRVKMTEMDAQHKVRYY